jgi:general secretion pathway protein M
MNAPQWLQGRVMPRLKAEGTGHDMPITPARSDTLLRHFASLSPRLQAALLAVAGVIGLALLLGVAVLPALRSLHGSPQRAQQAAAQWQTMQGLQAQAQALRVQPAMSAVESAARLQALMPLLVPAATHSPGDVAQLSLNGARASLTLKGVPAEALALWLARARTEAHAVTLQAQLDRLVRLPEPGPEGTTEPTRWQGELVLGLPP